MSYTDGLITAPGDPNGVEVYDVQRALGSASGDVGTLCTKRSAIKTWAKYRPLEFNSGGAPYKKPLTDLNRQSVNWGIKDIPIWSGGKRLGNVVNFWMNYDRSSTNCPDGYESGALPTEWWDCVLPTSCYRLTDFVSADNPNNKGYFIRANEPIGGLDFVEMDNLANGHASIHYRQNLDGITAGVTLFYSDLAVMNNIQFKNLYFGVVISIKVGNVTTTYIATQDNTVGELDGGAQTLWGMGPTVYFKIGTSAESGILANYALNETPVSMFPILSTIHNYYGTNVISPVSENQQGEVFVAMQPPEEGVFTIMRVQGLINNLVAYKNRTASTRLIYYSFVLTCNDITADHYFDVTVELRDANGTTINSVLLYTNKKIAAGSSLVVNNNIDADNHGLYYNSVTTLYVFVTRGTSDTSSYMMDNSAYVMIDPTPPTPTPTV